MLTLDGTPVVPVTSPLGLRYAMIDTEDYEAASQHSWSMSGGKGKGRSGKYAATRTQGQTLYLHRLVAMRMGLIPPGVEKGLAGRWVSSIDHEDGDKLNCRRGNLKLKTRSEQMSNTNDGLRSSNRSGHRGVSEARPGRPKPWMAYVQVNGKSKNLGWYATVEEAAAARQRWDSDRREGAG